MVILKDMSVCRTDEESYFSALYSEEVDSIGGEFSTFVKVDFDDFVAGGLELGAGFVKNASEWWEHSGFVVFSDHPKY